jgi:hypothetical protein
VASKRQIDAEKARRLGTVPGIDWAEVDPEQFRRGLDVELKHGVRNPETNVTNDDLSLTGGTPGRICRGDGLPTGLQAGEMGSRVEYETAEGRKGAPCGTTRRVHLNHSPLLPCLHLAGDADGALARE